MTLTTNVRGIRDTEKKPEYIVIGSSRTSERPIPWRGGANLQTSMIWNPVLSNKRHAQLHYLTWPKSEKMRKPKTKLIWGRNQLRLSRPQGRSNRLRRRVYKYALVNEDTDVIGLQVWSSVDPDLVLLTTFTIGAGTNVCFNHRRNRRIWSFHSAILPRTDCSLK
jgi:hypothetical protein